MIKMNLVDETFQYVAVEVDVICNFVRATWYVAVQEKSEVKVLLKKMSGLVEGMKDLEDNKGLKYLKVIKDP